MFFFFKQKTAYEMRISDWSSDVCSSDLTGALVVYANSFTATETDEDGEESEREIPYLKGYTVFNCEQIEGLPAHYYARAEEPASPVARREQADAFFAAPREIRRAACRESVCPDV